MYSHFKITKKYLLYWLSASNGKGHGVHSPFVFDFITHVLNDKKQYGCYPKIETLRKSLITDTTVLSVEDFGAGSRTGVSSQRSVASIAKNGLKPRKFSQLIYRIAKYYQPATILELGTSLGVTSSYLASSHPAAKLYTLEGAPAIAEVAKQNFKHMGLLHIKQVIGNFDETLVPLLNELPGIDLAFMDGNHRQEPTLRYFNQLLPHCHNDTILIFDDVHWSQEMDNAWQQIKEHQSITLTIDLFFITLVFFKKEFKVKQHFSIRY